MLILHILKEQNYTLKFLLQSKSPRLVEILQSFFFFFFNSHLKFLVEQFCLKLVCWVMIKGGRGNSYTLISLYLQLFFSFFLWEKISWTKSFKIEPELNYTNPTHTYIYIYTRRLINSVESKFHKIWKQLVFLFSVHWAKYNFLIHYISNLTAYFYLAKQMKDNEFGFIFFLFFGCMKWKWHYKHAPFQRVSCCVSLKMITFIIYIYIYRIMEFLEVENSNWVSITYIYIFIYILFYPN